MEMGTPRLYLSRSVRRVTRRGEGADGPTYTACSGRLECGRACCCCWWCPWCAGCWNDAAGTACGAPVVMKARAEGGGARWRGGCRASARAGRRGGGRAPQHAAPGAPTASSCSTPATPRRARCQESAAIERCPSSRAAITWLLLLPASQRAGAATPSSWCSTAMRECLGVPGRRPLHFCCCWACRASSLVTRWCARSQTVFVSTAAPPTRSHTPDSSDWGGARVRRCAI